MVSRQKRGANSKPTYNQAPQKQNGKKGNKRTRGQKPKFVSVLATGELPNTRKLKNGKTRLLDVYKKEDDSILPRKTRDMLAMMANLTGKDSLQSGSTAKPNTANDKKANDRNSNRNKNNKGDKANTSSSSDAKNTNNRNNNSDNKASSPSSSSKSAKSAKERMKEGMRDGESYRQFSARLRDEAKKAIIASRKAGTRRAEKRKAYYARKDERKERKRRRRQGIASDSEDDHGIDAGDDVEGAGRRRFEEEEDEELMAGERRLSELPMYWQEIVRNGGRPISDKKRKRMARIEKEQEDRVQFGEQAQRPPQFDSLPRQRGRTNVK